MSGNTDSFVLGHTVNERFYIEPFMQGSGLGSSCLFHIYDMGRLRSLLRSLGWRGKRL